MTETRPGGGPTVLRMILGRQLQALREKAGMSYEQAAEAIYSSPYTVRRMERAEGGLKPLTVKSLLMAYGITDVREIDAFLALARDASKPGWWHSYDDVLPSWFRTFVGLEEAASLIRGYDPHCDPRAAADPGLRPRQRPHRLPRRQPTRKPSGGSTLRLARQHILTRPDPPTAVAGHRRDRAAPPGRHHRPGRHARPDRHADRGRRPAEHHHPGAAVHRRAAPGHVRAVPDLPVRRPPSSPTSSTARAMTSAYYVDKPDETAVYVQALDRISAQAAPSGDTAKLLRDIRKEM